MTPDDMIDALSVPFPNHALKERKGAGGQMFTYVEAETVIRFLNATVKVWDFRLTEIRVMDDLLVVWGELTIPGLGTRTGTGVQRLSGGEDMWKGAASDCLKKCATLFNVGIDLYGPDLVAGELPNTQQTRSAPPRATEPPRKASTTTNTAPNLAVGDANTVTDWTVMWDRVRRMGLPVGVKELKAHTGIDVGQNPAYALEQIEAWAHDHGAQPALTS